MVLITKGLQALSGARLRRLAHQELKLFTVNCAKICVRDNCAVFKHSDFHDRAPRVQPSAFTGDSSHELRFHLCSFL